MDNVDWESAPALQESPVTSAICEPVNGSQIDQGTDDIPGMALTPCLTAAHLQPSLLLQWQ